MDTMQKPTHYTSIEGRVWEPWPLGYINTNDVKTYLQDMIVLESFPVHALKFKDGREWDEVNGWRNSTPNCTCSDDPREMACDTCLNSLKDSPIEIKLGDSLIKAHSIINGERQDSYGNPEDSFALIAEYWNAYFSEGNMDLKKLTALDVAHMMMLFKIARCTGQQSKRDNYIDIQGYAAIAADRLVKE
jgi:hypothetical protein